MSSPRLLDQVRDRLRVKHYNMRTETGPAELRRVAGRRIALRFIRPTKLRDALVVEESVAPALPEW